MQEKTILKSKTFWMAIVVFLTVFTSWALGTIDLWALIIAAVAMLGTIFYRSSLDTNLHDFLNKFKWWRDKTAWTAIAAALGLISTWLAGEIAFSQMLIGVFTTILTIFLRSGSEVSEE